MSLLLVYPKDKKIEDALISLFEVMKVDYEQEPETDETERILANPVMHEGVKTSIQEAREGKVTKKDVNNLWKYYLPIPLKPIWNSGNFPAIFRF